MMNAQNKIDSQVNIIPVQHKKPKNKPKTRKLSLAQSSTNSSFDSDMSQPSFEAKFQPLNSFSLEEISLYNVQYFLKEDAGRVYANSPVNDFFQFFLKLEEIFGFQKFVLEKFVSSENFTYQNLIEFFDLIKENSEQISQYKSKYKPQRLVIETLSILMERKFQKDLIFDILVRKGLTILDVHFYQTQEWQDFSIQLIKNFSTDTDHIFDLLTQEDTIDVLQHSLMDTIQKKKYKIYQQNFFNYFQDHSIKNNQLFELFCFFQYFHQAFEILKQNQEFQNCEFYQVLLTQMINQQKVELEILEDLYQMIMDLDIYNEDLFLEMIEGFLMLDDETQAIEIQNIMIQKDQHVDIQKIYQKFINYYATKNEFQKIENILEKFQNENRLIPNNWIESLFNSLILTSDFELTVKYIRKYKDDYIISTNILSGVCNLFKTSELTKEQFINFYKLSKEIFNEHHLKNAALLNYYLSIALYNKCYDIFDEVFQMSKHFSNNIVRSNLAIKKFLNEEQYEECYNFIKDMELDEDWVNCSIGRLLNYFTQRGDVEQMETIYQKMSKYNAQFCSIDFTNFIYTYQKANRPEDGLKFFEQIKHHRDYAGMRITYNCALNLYTSINRIDDAIFLFDEIDTHFKADHISYNTIIKALCNNKKIQMAYKYVNKLLDNLEQIEEIGENFFNYFLESCSDKKFYSIGIKTYKQILQHNCKVNIITMGTMVKLYGFAQKINKAFELLEFMKQQNIEPNLIYFTNLVHISFYSKNYKAAIKAFDLCCQHNMPKDSIFYSKIIDGMIFMKKKKQVLSYMKQANKEKCGLRKQTIQKLENFCKDENSQNILEQIKQQSMTHCFKEKGFQKNNGQRVKKFRNMALQKKAYNDNRKMNNQQTRRSGFNQAKIEGLMDNQTKSLVAQFRKRKVHQYQLNCF